MKKRKSVYFCDAGYESDYYSNEPPEPHWMGGIVIAESKAHARYLMTIQFDLEFTDYMVIKRVGSASWESYSDIYTDSREWRTLVESGKTDLTMEDHDKFWRRVRPYWSRNLKW
jgi:hypothetical protein